MTAPLVVLMPVYNDWPLIPPLLTRLDAALAETGLATEVVLADDGSTTPLEPTLLEGARFRAISSVTVLHLGRNAGHQRALAIGLAYVHAARTCRAVVVMDADGEDAPEDVPRLVAALGAGEGPIVFAGRSRRSEGLLFRAFYELYRLTHRLLTGRRIWFGNFSAVPARLLPRLVLLSELWNHYPSAVIKARIPFTSIPLPRAPRLGGRSHMGFTGLILHGLGAIAVHGDVIGVRALVATLAAIVVCLSGIATVVLIRTVTDLAIPGWASAIVGLLVAILLQAVLLSLVFIFVTLNSRDYSAVIPRRDYADYIAGETRLFP
jgi:glycosyltransferase involved in cell wall biosynthesis